MNTRKFEKTGARMNKKRLAMIGAAMLVLFVILNAVSCKKSDADEIITVPVVVWGGYAAMFAANGGSEPSEESLFYKYGNYKVKIVQIDDPALHLTGFVKGDYPIIWSTVDMIPLQYESLGSDPRTVPKVLGLFDYSAGGDGIIVRGEIASGTELAGKKIVCAQYTPSHTFILWYLDQNGIGPDDVEFIFTEDAIAAKDTYIADDSIDVCVTWSPFIYDITDPTRESYIPGSVLHKTTAPGTDAHGVIADVYLARADFVKEHPDKVQAFVKAMTEGYEIYKANQEKTATDLAGLFGLQGGAEEAMLMFGDATIGGPVENGQLFDESYQFNVYNLFNLSADLYKKAGKLPQDFAVDAKEIAAPEFMLKAIGR
jgi:ABC-type nitrate/sulfonate/bicarbonate transport system substrate-binding protein